MENQTPMSCTLKGATMLLLLVLAVTCVSSARILDEELPPSTPVVVPPESPTSGVQPSVGGATTGGSTVANVDTHHSLSFFMHDVLGGSNPSARVVTGMTSNSVVNGQLPFAKSNGGVFPVNGGVPLTNGNNGIINNNNNNMPFVTGLGGQSPTTVIQNNGNNVNVGNGLPFVTAGQLPAGATLQKLLFGTLTVIDDELTEGHELGSAVLGKAQGFYVASSEDGTSQTMAFTAMFENGSYTDTLSFFGVHRTVSSECQVAVIGGTGKYANAKGYATIKTVHAVDQHTTDGVETLLELTVYLSY
ncbi:dirigent protein 10-like isoform X4 [Tasmannia lanceolata]|uniref:dirigent protein 10-like isoform X4 n=1 Tax=Tasmannia lanceolata TaxID=3420 RepID=UPI0040646673